MESTNTEPKRIGQEEVVGTYRRNVTPRMSGQIVRLLRDAYMRADEQVRPFDPRIAKRAKTVFRPWLVESMLIELAERYNGDGFRAEVHYTRKSRTPHTVLFINDVAFTISKTADPDSLPRYAVFRQQYSRSQQLILPTMEAPPDFDMSVLNDVELYFVITHGPASGADSAPNFVVATAWDADSKKVLGRVDVHAEARGGVLDITRRLRDAQPQPSVEIIAMKDEEQK